jgi:hypothetical protein
VVFRPAPPHLFCRQGDRLRERRGRATVCSYAAVAMLGSLLFCGLAAYAQKPVAPSASAKPSPTAQPTLQIQRQVSGDLLYRFLAPNGAPTAPVPLPTPTDANQVVAITLPANLPKNAVLEVINRTTGKVAHLPVKTNGVTALTDADFTLVQTVMVPVQVEGKGGLTDAVVTLTSSDGKYKASWLLKAADKGVAQFTNVPMGVALTVTVKNDDDPPISQTQTLPTNPPAEGYHWPTITVTWPDAHSVPLPAAPSAPTTPPPGVTPTPPAPPPSNPLGDIISTLIGLGVIGGIGYGVVWAYRQGHLRRFFEGIGMHIPEAQSQPDVQPFKKPEQPPLPPITEGTADPFASGVAGSPRGVGGGPRLVGTMGVYAGQIFELQGPQVDIGRDSSNTVVLLQDSNVSRRHASIQNQGEQFVIVDNGSSNGTFVNGVRIPPLTPHPLHPGDEIQVGMTRFRFEI